MSIRHDIGVLQLAITVPTDESRWERFAKAILAGVTGSETPEVQFKPVESRWCEEDAREDFPASQGYIFSLHLIACGDHALSWTKKLASKFRVHRPWEEQDASRLAWEVLRSHKIEPCDCSDWVELLEVCERMEIRAARDTQQVSEWLFALAR